MAISSQTLRFEARRKSGVGFIHTQLASSYTNAPQQLASSPSTVGFITRDFHALISRQHSQTNRRGLYTLFLTTKSRCMQKISFVDALYLPHKTCCPYPVTSAAAIPDEANCSWLHQSHHCELKAVNSLKCCSCCNQHQLQWKYKYNDYKPLSVNQLSKWTGSLNWNKYVSVRVVP